MKHWKVNFAYGTDYIISNEKNNNELLKIKFANNLRLRK